MFPSIHLLWGDIRDPEVSAETCRAYNNWMSDFCKASPERLFGIGIVPLQDVDLATREAARLAGLGLRGLAVRPERFKGALGGLGLGRATVEVYRFYDGRQWAATFVVDVGDYIGGVKDFRLPDRDDPVQIDFNTDLLVLDVVEDVNAPRTGPLAAGRPAKVLLQDLRTGRILALRDPRLEKLNPDRRTLKDKVDSAGL